MVYASSWLKCHYPDVFATALLNSQPMGFYSPSQIIRDAQEHGVEIRSVDVNCPISRAFWRTVRAQSASISGPSMPKWPIISVRARRSGWACRFVEGLADADANIIIARRGTGYDSVRDLWLRTGLGPPILEKLANADAFASLGLSRRDALWAVKGLMGTDGAQTLPLFASAKAPYRSVEADADLPAMPPGEAVIHDYKYLSFSLKGHPVGFLRPVLERKGMTAGSDQLSLATPGRFIEVAGLVLVRQRPGTASGVIFATLEDETGIANVVIWPKVFEAYRRTVLASRMLAVRGQLQREGLVIHIIAKEMVDMTPHAARPGGGARYRRAHAGAER